MAMRKAFVFTAAVVLAYFATSQTPGTAQAQRPAFDLLIRGGRIVDGTGNPWFTGDVAVAGDTIVAIGPSLEPGSAQIIDARGQVVAPGFIDVHSHAEERQDKQDIIGNPGAENNVRQGVTTVFASPDGGGSVQVAAFLAKVEAARPAINVG